MGAGIAHAFLVAGAEVTVVERDAAAAAAARDRATGTLSKAIEKAAVTEDLDSLLARVAVSTDTVDFGSAGLVVEAVPEDFRLKQSALLNVERNLGADAWIATNTSSLSVTKLTATLGRPERSAACTSSIPSRRQRLWKLSLDPGPPGSSPAPLPAGCVAWARPRSWSTMHQASRVRAWALRWPWRP